MDFWQYFKDYLAFSLIQQKNAIAVLIKGLALTMDNVKKDILALRDQFVVPKADDSLISPYGISRGIPRTRFDSDKQYRIRTEKALAWHKLGGKNEGLIQILAEYGYPHGEVENLRDRDPAKWATFNINLLDPGSSLEQNTVNAIYEIANMYKPGRSKLESISFALRQEALLYALSSQRSVASIKHNVTFGELDIPNTVLFVPVRQLNRITIKINISEVI